MKGGEKEIIFLVLYFFIYTYIGAYIKSWSRSVLIMFWLFASSLARIFLLMISIVYPKHINDIAVRNSDFSDKLLELCTYFVDQDIVANRYVFC